MAHCVYTFIRCLYLNVLTVDPCALQTDRQTDRLREAGRLTEALALIGGTVNVDLGADDVAEWQEHLRQFSVAELLWQMVDEQVAAFWTNWRRRTLVHASCQQASTQPN